MGGPGDPDPPGTRRSGLVLGHSQLVGACARNPSRDISAVTSSGRVTSSVTLPFDSAGPLSYRLPTVNNPLSPVVSEILARTHDLPNATQVHTPAVGWFCHCRYLRDEATEAAVSIDPLKGPVMYKD